MTTLADLLVRAHLHRSSFPKCALHSMSKSVRRVAEAAGTLPQDHDAGGVLAEHAALAGTVDSGPKQFREDQANRKRLLDRKSTRLTSRHTCAHRTTSSA